MMTQIKLNVNVWFSERVSHEWGNKMRFEEIPICLESHLHIG